MAGARPFAGFADEPVSINDGVDKVEGADVVASEDDTSECSGLRCNGFDGFFSAGGPS